MKKITRLMSKVFSEATPPEEKVAVAENIAEAKATGFSEDEDHTYAANEDGDIEIADKFTGETTVHSGVGEDGTILLEPKEETTTHSDITRNFKGKISNEDLPKLKECLKANNVRSSVAPGSPWLALNGKNEDIDKVIKECNFIGPEEKATTHSEPEDGEKELGETITDTKKLADAEVDPEKKEALEQKTESLKRLFSKTFGRTFSEPVIIDTKGTKEELGQQNMIPNKDVTAEGAPIVTIDAAGDKMVKKTTVASNQNANADAPPTVTETDEEKAPTIKKPELSIEAKMESDNEEMNRLMDPDKNNKGFEVATKKEADPETKTEKPGEEAPKIKMEEPINEGKTFSDKLIPGSDGGDDQFNNLITQNLGRKVI